MNFKLVLFSATLGVAMASCSNEEVENNLFNGQNTIGFNVVSNSMQRATPTTNDNLTSTDFNVFAFQGDTLYLGAAGEGRNGVTIKYEGNAWIYNNPGEQRYWPTETYPLDFYAINPATVDDKITNEIYKWNFAADKQTITYVCNPNEYSTDSYKNIDIMYAIANNQTSTTNNGTVKFQFKHILSQVAFKAKTERNDIDVAIKSIDIKNVKTSGTFALPANSTTEATQTNWTLEEAIADFKAYNSETGLEIDGENNAIPTAIDPTNPLLIIPQTLTKWAIPSATTAADAAGQSYLAIECKIWQNNVLIVGSESAFTTIYVPFEATWQPGYRYIYTLVFGGGYNSNGQAILTPIKIEAESTTDWVDTPSDITL